MHKNQAAVGTRILGNFGYFCDKSCKWPCAPVDRSGAWAYNQIINNDVIDNKTRKGDAYGG